MPRLPGWATPNDDSVRREAAPYRDLTPAGRAEHLAAACRAAALLLEARPDRDLAVARLDPLPEDSRRALARLRAQAQRRGGR